MPNSVLRYVADKDLILTSGKPSVNRTDLLALTFAGPTWHKPVLDLLAVQLLENRLYMIDFKCKKEKTYQA